MSPTAMIARVIRGRLLLAVSLLVLAAAVPMAWAAHSKTSVKVTEKEFKMLPTPTKAKAGVVAFSIKNAGLLQHEFIVLKSNVPPAKLPVKGSKAVLKGKIYGAVNVARGTTRTLYVKLPAGKYILLCNLPAHYQAGQRAGFRVG